MVIYLRQLQNIKSKSFLGLQLINSCTQQPDRLLLIMPQMLMGQQGQKTLEVEASYRDLLQELYMMSLTTYSCKVVNSLNEDLLEH